MQDSLMSAKNFFTLVIILCRKLQGGDTMSVVIQLLQNNEVLRARLLQLENSELRVHSRLSTSSLYHPGQSIRIKVPRKIRSIYLLFEIKEYLPVTLRIEVEKYYSDMMRHLSKFELLQLEKLRLHLTQNSNSRFIQGRLPELMLQALEECRFQIILPRTPKRKERPRGYNDGSGSWTLNSSTENSARRSADQAAVLQKENLYQEMTMAELSAAEVILQRERLGEDSSSISGSPAAVQTDAKELRDMLDAVESSESHESKKNGGFESLLRAAGLAAGPRR
jgi:hypothetical protein